MADERKQDDVQEGIKQNLELRWFQILSRGENNAVARLTVLRCPLGHVAAPVAPVLAVFEILAANLSDVNRVWSKVLESERLDVLGRVLKRNLRGRQTCTSH